MSEHIIEIRNLTKTYKIYNKPSDRLKEAITSGSKIYSREFHALQDISFDIKKGENVGIIGTNGSGKSTLLKIITGVLSETAGEVKVRGRISALLELGAGFNQEYTGIENIYLNGMMMGYSREQMQDKVEDIVRFSGIGEFVNQPVKNYSSGMFARLAFSVAINVEPDILIVDEALSVGDTRFQMKCMKRMKEMMSGGTTVLFVSHDVSAIKKFCTRVIWLNDGMIMGEGSVRKLTNQYAEFLKKGTIVLETSCNDKFEDSGENEEVLEIDDTNIPFDPGNNIADIVAFHFRNSKGNEVSKIRPSDEITIEVVYDVYDESIRNPVLGVAMQSKNDDYMCGLNTLLDKVAIPWKYGRNRMKLIYECGVSVASGNYFLDAALMDETASVNLSHKGLIKEFTVEEEIISEGKIIIPHCWNKEKEDR